MTARAAILERLKRAERTGHVPRVDQSARSLTPPAALSPDQMLAQFIAELTAIGVQSFVEESAAAVKTRVIEAVAAQSVLQWDASELPYGVGSLFDGAATGASPRAAQAAAAVGVTAVDAAIAETGTLALLSGPGKPRAASLLPLAHIAVVRRSDLVATMGDFFALRADAIARAASCAFITGPSRTADIELTLTLGVHGPGSVIVVVGP